MRLFPALLALCGLALADETLAAQLAGVRLSSTSAHFDVQYAQLNHLLGPTGE